jgi:3',5'-cyclic-nucleotide phosphodiesterase
LKNQEQTTDIYATEHTLGILTTHFINGTVYPKFTEWPSSEKPALKLIAIEPLQPFSIREYTILAIPVSHSIPAWGFQITDSDGTSIFFSGDTGPGLQICWVHIAPQIMIMDMGFSNKSVDIASKPGHLCPSLLGEELLDFHRIKGYFPKVIITHMNPDVENEVEEEARQLAYELGIDISLAYEDMMIEI